jgi:autotransporter family porin
MRAGLTMLLAVATCAAAAVPAGATDLVTRPHAKRPLPDAQAAKLVKRGRFEPRPANRDATRRVPTAAQLRAFRAQSQMPYARYVTGRFRGTTDEVIQWAARKWGFKPDLLRAVATVESWWRMSTVGDGGDSFGLFQVRRPYHCAEPVCEQFRTAGAFNADYYAGILRSYYDGEQRWLDTVGDNGKRYRRGDLWGSVGAWFSGRWWNEPARGYVRQVKQRLRERTWRTRDFRGG